MTTPSDIQKDLPNWQLGVIEPWLAKFANDPGMGWPPPERYGDHRWGRLLESSLARHCTILHDIVAGAFENTASSRRQPRG